MDFPSSKKSNYASKVEASQSSSPDTSNLIYMPVPGPQGVSGPRGEQGNVGPVGPVGPRGDRGVPGAAGKDGRNGNDGRNGKDGKSVETASGQHPGWAVYQNENPKPIRLGAAKGEDGWVSFHVDLDPKTTNETFLPKTGISLYSPTAKRLNFKPLVVGAKIDVTYSFEVETFGNNTELWIRTYFPKSEKEMVSYIGSLKYQYPYEMSVTQTLFLEKDLDRIFGAVPQLRSDLDCIAKIKSIHISVS